MAKGASSSDVTWSASTTPEDILIRPAVDQAAFLTRDPQRLPGFVRSHIRRIEATNAKWRALSYWSAESIIAQMGSIAPRFDQFDGSVLWGLGVTFKGNIPIAGTPWTEGSALYRKRMAAADAEIVVRVRQAGGIVLGSTTLTELAMYAPDNPDEPVALNPFAPDRTPGGSSPGAAVAAAMGMGAVHFGTDSGGSIRNPACHCGVVGFKPIRGLLPMGGLTVYSPTLDTLGVVTRSAADLAPVFRALQVGDFASRSVERDQKPRELAVLVPWSLVHRYCTPGAFAAFSETLDDIKELIGARVIDVEVASWDDGQSAAGLVSLHEGGRALACLDLAHAGPAIRERVGRAQALSPQAVDRAYETMQAFADEIHGLMARHPGAVVVTPTWPFGAPLIHQTTVNIRGEEKPVDPWRNIFVRSANAADAPAITIPCLPLPGEAAPAGLHLMAPHGSDGSLVANAVALEQALVRSGRRAPPGPPILSKTFHEAKSEARR